MKTLSLLVIIVSTITSCSTSLHFEGNIAYVNKDTVGIQNQKFVVETDTAKIGQYATFKSTVNRRKINSRIIRP